MILLLEDSRVVSQGVGVVPTPRGLGCGLSHEYEVMGSGPGVPVTEPTLHTHGDSCLCGCDLSDEYYFVA